jgi:hypothetical protein
MKKLEGKKALVTAASRGIGPRRNPHRAAIRTRNSPFEALLSE